MKELYNCIRLGGYWNVQEYWYVYTIPLFPIPMQMKVPDDLADDTLYPLLDDPLQALRRVDTRESYIRVSLFT